MVRIKTTAFTKLKPGDLILKAQDIVNGLASYSAEFPNPVPPIAAIQPVIDELSVRTVEAESGDRNKIRDRNMTRDALIAQLLELSNYVAMECQNKPNGKLLAENVGFEVARRGTPIGQLSEPLGLLSTPSAEPGAVDLTWEKVQGAYSYQVEYIAGTEVGPLAQWQILGASSRRRFHATSLNPGQFYSFRVRAYGAAGFSAPSDVTTSVVG